MHLLVRMAKHLQVSSGSSLLDINVRYKKCSVAHGYPRFGWSHQSYLVLDFQCFIVWYRFAVAPPSILVLLVLVVNESLQ